MGAWKNVTVCGDVETETLGFVREFSKAPERGREIKRDREGNVERERGVSVQKTSCEELPTYRADIEREERRKESWRHHKVLQVKLKCIIYIKVSQKIRFFLLLSPLAIFGL